MAPTDCCSTRESMENEDACVRAVRCCRGTGCCGPGCRGIRCCGADRRVADCC